MSETSAPMYSRFIPGLIITAEQATREAKLDELLSGLSAIAADTEQTRRFREMLERDIRDARDAMREHQAVN